MELSRNEDGLTTHPVVLNRNKPKVVFFVATIGEVSHPFVSRFWDWRMVMKFRSIASVV
jgi:hypothetical protein